MNAATRRNKAGTELARVPSARQDMCVDPVLAERLQRLAAASGRQYPKVIPGAAALILPLHLPIKSAEKRRKAARFAMEAHIAAPLEDVIVAVGPELTEGHFLCVCVARDLVSDAPSGFVVPDVCAVPLPSDPACWSLWIGESAAYVRLSGGEALTVELNEVADLWQAFGRPGLEVYHGPLPEGMSDAQPMTEAPELNAGWLDMRLHSDTYDAASGVLRCLKAAAAILILGLLGHSSLLHLDARALGQIVAERQAQMQERLQARGLSFDPRSDPAVLADRLIRNAQSAGQKDAFLHLFATVASALPTEHALAFRDLQYDASTGALIFVAQAPDLTSLQATEDALLQASLRLQSGAAVQGAEGAEMQFIVSGGT